ncbi:MAG: nucleotidyltransferase family protein [Pyrinomonadaceae bacterium]
MMEREASYASIILRLLLDGIIDPLEQRTIVWGDLLQIAAQNGVLIRLVDRLETIGLEPRHFFFAAVKDMRARNQRKLALIDRISESCLENNIDFIFAKIVQNYPDMTGDIDLYIASRSRQVDAAILTGLHAVRVKRRLRNLIDGTVNYRLRQCDSLLEIHHGRVGMLGEHGSYISQVIENGSHVRVDGNEFLIPSPEDQLVLQGLQRPVARSYLRLSDVVTTIGLFRANTLDWNYILKTVTNLNTLYGLSCYLSFVEKIHRETFKRNLLPDHVVSALALKRTSTIDFKEGFYRFQRIKVGGRGYVIKFWSAVLSENWAVASRLSLLPLVALTTIVRKFRLS